MEFVIRKSDLVRELQTVTGVVEKRATLPILANLLIEAKDKALHVGASDLEVTIRGTAEASVTREGSVTLPAGKLHEIARSLPEADVQFKLLERNQVAIVCERTRYRIAGQSREDEGAIRSASPGRGNGEDKKNRQRFGDPVGPGWCDRVHQHCDRGHDQGREVDHSHRWPPTGRSSKSWKSKLKSTSGVKGVIRTCSMVPSALSEKVT